MYSIAEVAEVTGIATHRIRYLLDTDALKEPLRVNGRRAFTAADIEAIRRHFEQRRTR